MSVDLNKLSTTLDDLERTLSNDWGLKRISGGFVKISLDYIDEKSNTIFLTCKSGVQNDVEDDVKIDELKMDLKTFKLK